jgi:hypothetical protein
VKEFLLEGYGMNQTPLQGSLKKMRALTFALICSGALNIALLVKGVISQMQPYETQSMRVITEKKTHFETTLDSFFVEVEKKSFHELVSCLTNQELIEEGYLKRDLALSALVAFHHFHIEKALGGLALQKREFSFREKRKIFLFPGLSDLHFQAILRFAYEEKWPLTAEGMFLLLPKIAMKDPSLSQAFFITSEFRFLEVLFQKTGAPQSKEKLLELVREGSWDLLAQFAKEQAQALDFSLDRRRSLLLNYIGVQSKTAAYMLLNTDFSFALKRFGEEEMLAFLSLLQEKKEESEKFCVELLKSPRSDAVWASAASALYRYAGESCPSCLAVEEVVSRFGGASLQKEELIRSEKTKEHVVKEGESLWKIARQYNVKVDDVIKVNVMENDRLYPGMILKIP